MRTRTVLVCALAAAGTVLTGCAARQRLQYRLTRINGVPAIASPAYAEGAREIRVIVPGAAVSGRPAAECALTLESFRVSASSKGAVAARVDLESLFPQGAYDEVAQEAFLSFRRELEALEEKKGCLTGGAGRLVAERVAEALPMPLQDITFYRNGYNVLRGYVDLAPGARALQQSVAASDGAAVTDVITYEFAARPNSDGAVVRAVGAHPELSFVRWDAADKASAHYRLFLRTRSIHHASSKQETHAVLLAAPNLEALDELTRGKDAEDACAEASGKLPCVIFPHRVTVGPQIRVWARGKPAWVDVTAKAGELALRGAPKTPPKLKLRRLYAGKLIPVDLTGAGPLALRLPLVAGDELKW